MTGTRVPKYQSQPVNKYGCRRRAIHTQAEMAAKTKPARATAGQGICFGRG